SADNRYDYPITPKWQGWQMVSFTYNKAVIKNTGNPSAPQNPSKILQIGFIHLGDLGMPSEIVLDYPCFTYGTPLEP
ncbi:MAG: hypothetical protein K2Q22_00050, partial [Cytophagales bacterium]|nr:hypothetical protein [Cytophagales bacterium]